MSIPESLRRRVAYATTCAGSGSRQGNVCEKTCVFCSVHVQPSSTLQAQTYSIMLTSRRGREHCTRTQNPFYRSFETKLHAITYKRAHLHIHVRAHTHARTHALSLSHAHTHTHTLTNNHTHTHTHAHTHTHTHTRTHAHTHSRCRQ